MAFLLATIYNPRDSGELKTGKDLSLFSASNLQQDKARKQEGNPPTKNGPRKDRNPKDREQDHEASDVRETPRGAVEEDPRVGHPLRCADRAHRLLQLGKAFRILQSVHEVNLFFFHGLA